MSGFAAIHAAIAGTRRQMIDAMKLKGYETPYVNIAWGFVDYDLFVEVSPHGLSQPQDAWNNHYLGEQGGVIEGDLAESVAACWEHIEQLPHATMSPEQLAAATLGINPDGSFITEPIEPAPPPPAPKAAELANDEIPF